MASSFCDCKSVPASTASGIHHWAAEKVRFPPPGEIGESIELRGSDSLGLHAVAQRSFDSGELILSEEPLIRIPDSTTKGGGSGRGAQEHFGELSAFVAPAFAVDWGAVSQEERKAALKLFFAHPQALRGARSKSPSLVACREILAKSAQLRLATSWEANDLLRFLHVVDLNIHRDDERPANAGFTGIFVLGSKFSHSCAPNCSWSFTADGLLQYRAIRPISPGELFSFSYVGNGMNLLTSTIERRRRLGQLWFVCRCSRCCGPDLARQLRCPTCSAPCCLPVYGENFEGVKVPFSENLPEASTWRCASCGSTCSRSEMPLREESELARLIVQAMQGHSEDAEMHGVQLGRLRLEVAKVLGKSHWTWFLATFAWLQKGLVRIQAEPVVPFSEAELRSASVAVARWLEAFAPDNVEQRMSALFIASRLAKHLGEGVRDWGYDPAEPLGAKLRAGPRLQALGWQLLEDQGLLFSNFGLFENITFFLNFCCYLSYLPRENSAPGGFRVGT
ncbi:unnamed protein product [Polarella glacialis]|uniref:SET domain-containing protein n=1 Tax=Polarella glacialis TaxID=89957 RepID=A0A813F4B2_POLGL|nr:unnamed protein product [Polarella glacialis]